MQTIPAPSRDIVSFFRTLANIGVKQTMSPPEKKRVVLSNQLFLIAAGVTLSFLPLGLALGTSAIGTVTSLIDTLLLAGCFFLNYRGQYKMARVMGLVVGNSLTFFWVLALGNQMYPELFYFTLAAAPLLFIGPDQKKSLYVLSLLSVVLFFVSHELKAKIAPMILIPGDIALLAGYSTGVLSFITLLSILYYFHRGTERVESELDSERKKSDRLLLNILPEPIADRLKAGERLIADRFDRATVLFADIVNFTPMSGSMPADEVVSILSRIFSAFDMLCEKNGMEKIKTIGDSYMAAAGLPEPDENHMQSAARMALDMQQMILEMARREGMDLIIRIGIQSGPVVAGVIGEKKFIYDLWGDTVNLASRMESHGIPGQIQVSQHIYETLHSTFTFETRGLIEVKGKGPMQTYFLTGSTRD